MQKGLKSLRNQGKQLTWEQRTGKRRYIIRAAGQCLEALRDNDHDPRTCKNADHKKTTGERAIPSEFDMAIQHYSCQESECSQRPFACKDRTHRRAVVGGLAPSQLVNRGMQHRPVLSESLNDTYAQQQAAKERTVNALLANAENDRRLQDAQSEVQRLTAEIARKEAELRAATVSNDETKAKGNKAPGHKD